MKKIISIDRVMVLAVAIPMTALFVGYLSYVNITKFIQENALADRTNFYPLCTGVQRSVFFSTIASKGRYLVVGL